ncbi:osmoprotectant transport system permease protein [Gracilibacillus orientalis]|uniref:Osmoprotectant transport system permease protein n=1 Tax=Gracilibacillus orientalis TaxID=334253 RepID=A0A1I4P1B5_9BACI|nr:ABC transporter permease [Gracilibacillus orientalis]SFM21317.1 osmoprotectant transport system permease protein [Gracilibacillus orientalis]
MNAKKTLATTTKIILWLLVIVFFWWALSNHMFSKIVEQPAQFISLLETHLKLVSISAGIAILTSIPLGILITRPKFRKFEWLIVNTANLGQTIPSLAILALAMGFLGIGIKAAIVALYIYSLLPILQNTIAGLDSVNPATKDAAKGMGLTSTQILFRVELPSAAYSILAGVRTAVVLNIGTAALAYLIGGGGLGVWIFTGIQLFDNSFLISGAVPVTLLAVIVDLLFRGLQLLLVPKGLRLARKAAIDSV